MYLRTSFRRMGLLLAVLMPSMGACQGDGGGGTASPGSTTVGEVTLAADGAAVMPIVLGTSEQQRVSAAGADNPAPSQELAALLQRISGASYTAGEAQPGATGIYVGEATDFPWVPLGDLGQEEYLVRSDGQNLYLVGGGAIGASKAVYAFLERLGCRWFFPGSVWEVVPQQPTLRGTWDERGRPAFEIQREIWYGYGSYAACGRDKRQWDRHNGMIGSIPLSTGHTWFGLDPTNDFASHPEWFAYVGGNRQNSKPCYGHPDVIQKGIDYALARAAGGAKAISLSPPDGLGYCEDPTYCMPVFQGATPYAAHGTLFAVRPDGVLVNITSETVFAFVNRVAEAVAPQYPDVLLCCYGYSAYSHPPSFDFRPNVYIQTTTSYRRTPLTLKEQVEAFGRKTQNLGIREYYSVFQWDWDRPGGRSGAGNIEYLAKSLRFFYQNGITALNAEASINWGPRGLGYYLTSQLAWNINADTQAVMRDFYEKAFGPASTAMERHYSRWYGPARTIAPDAPPFDEAGQWIIEPVSAALNRETLIASYHDVDEAAGLVRDLPEYRDRVDHLRMYLHYLCLRERLAAVTATGPDSAILDAIREETVFGARLMNTNMIHSRPLIGKAFLRRFSAYQALLATVPEAQTWGTGWRTPREDVPTHEEMEALWAQDKAWLGM
ncbi:MAG: DUF4838 domain-containing protein [Planctomycetes bacterium]|nr:DUF4838 domain-containing protein [Planctomycetota bacterium]